MRGRARQRTGAGRELDDRAVTDHVATLDRVLAGVPGADLAGFTAMLAAVERTADT